MDAEEGLYLVIGMIIGMLVVSVIFGIDGDKWDVVNVRGLGEKVCGEYGLVYDYRDYPFTDILGYSAYIPRIHCKENVTKPILDGVIVKSTGGNGK